MIKYTRPEPIAGPALITYLSQVLDEDKGLGIGFSTAMSFFYNSYSTIGFFLIYELLTNAFNMTILSEDSSHSVGVILFRFLPETFVGSLQNVILRVLETHPELGMLSSDYSYLSAE